MIDHVFASSWYRWLRVAAVLGALLFLGARAARFVVTPAFPANADFVAYDASGLLYHNPQQLYDLNAQQNAVIGLLRQVSTPDPSKMAPMLPFSTPPFVALLFIPLARLPLWPALGLWDVISLALVLFVVVRWWSATGGGRRCLFWWLAVALSYFPVYRTLMLGQISTIGLLGWSEALLALWRGRDLRGGLWLGLLWIKPQELPLWLLVLAIKRRWRALAGVAATSAVFGLVCLTFWRLDWIGPFLHLAQQAAQSHNALNEHVTYQPTWRGMLELLLGRWPTAVDILFYALSAVTIVLVLWTWRRTPWQPDTRAWAGGLALTAVAALITSPHAQVHELLVFIPLAALVWWTMRQPATPPEDRRWWPAFLDLGWLCTGVIGFAIPSLPLVADVFMAGAVVALWWRQRQVTIAEPGVRP